MNLTIDLNGVDPVIAEVKKIAAPESLAKANERMGEGVKSWLSSWYRNKAESGHFENTSLPTHGPGRKKTGWANDIARNWFAETTADGARIYLTGQAGEGNGGEPLDLAQSLLLKIYGGTVTAKRAQALTIPVIPEAHGVRAGAYASMTGRKLFTLRKSILNLRNSMTGSGLEPGCLFESDGHGGVRAVYKPKKSQIFAPWPEAFPDMEELTGIAFKHFMDAMLDDGGGSEDWIN